VHHLWCWIIANAGAITAIAAFIAALATVAYFIATILIFRETKKAADATTEAAQAAKDNALAAKQSAGAAQSSAGAASESAALMREQFYEQANRDRSIVQTTVNSAVANIDHWRNLPIKNFGSAQIPPTDDLVPATADSAVECARRISSEATTLLSSAFDDMRKARRELETQRKAASNRPIPMDRVESYLNSALDKLMQVRAVV